jgi:hypothetical protein
MKAYADAVASGTHIVVKPGDRIPLAGIDVTVLASDRLAISRPLPGAGAPNPLCGAYRPHDVDHSENSSSRISTVWRSSSSRRNESTGLPQVVHCF